MQNFTKKTVFCLLGLIVLLAAGYARQVELNVALSNKYLLEGEKQSLYLKIGLKGFELANAKNRTPINVAIVLDRSGSMEGDKLEQAKSAAIFAVEQLDARDIVSVVVYDDLINVLVPATKATDKQSIIKAIRKVQAGGSTAIFAGVSKGAEEVRKFLDKNRVNRIILLSDGMANVGPDTPGAFAELGASLLKEGVSVTTIGLGLGYNEDLMVTLARAGDGNHAFVGNSQDLVKVFKYEFGDVMSVVAQEVVITVDCAQGIRPVRVLGREADIAGQQVFALLNQLYSNQEKYLLLELEIPSGKNGTLRNVVKVNVSYANMESKTADKIAGSADVRYTNSAEMVSANENDDVMVAAVMQIATLMNEEALRLRDKGDIGGAQSILNDNALLLKESAERYESDALYEYSQTNSSAAQNLDEETWNEQRKSMMKDQYSNKVQQSY